MADESADRKLLDLLIDYCAVHPSDDSNRFLENLRNAGDVWQPRKSQTLAATETLGKAAGLAHPLAKPLVDGFVGQKGRLHWEQSYRKSHGLVGDDMLAGYGFVEILGKHGPFVSETVRCGIGVWGPNINYPIHQHAAEEIYVVAAGRAVFTVGDAVDIEKHSGEAVYVESNTQHGFRTEDDPLVVFYAWQAGDMRELSRFQHIGPSK